MDLISISARKSRLAPNSSTTILTSSKRICLKMPTRTARNIFAFCSPLHAFSALFEQTKPTIFNMMSISQLHRQRNQRSVQKDLKAENQDGFVYNYLSMDQFVNYCQESSFQSSATTLDLQSAQRQVRESDWKTTRKRTVINERRMIRTSTTSDL